MFNMQALIIGSTGATGKDLLDLLLKDPFFEQVTIFIRRKSETQHQKLKVQVIDFDKPEDWKHLVIGDVLFSLLGTTMKAAGSKEAQWKVDYDYQYSFAKAASENNVPNYVLISAAMSSPNSRLFYSRMKGQLEEAVKSLQFESINIFKPPMLIRKDTDRPGETFGIKFINFFNKLGLFKSQKAMPTETLAQAMINAVKSNDKGIKVFNPIDIWRRAQPNFS